MGEVKHTDRAERIPHNGASSGTSSLGDVPPHFNFSVVDGEHVPNEDYMREC